MNTIYDGTYTIGQTSATNFQAGPGISITQPSEGTVRIANDETVLWSGDVKVTTANTITLSEPLTAFEKFKIIDYPFGLNHKPAQETTFFNFNPSGFYLFGTTHAWIDDWQSTASGSKYEGDCYYSANSAFNTLLTMGSFILSMGTSGTYSMRNEGHIFRVVGVNRISGGNA